MSKKTKAKPYKGPFVIVSVQPTDRGSFDARYRGDESRIFDFSKAPVFYFALRCGHESEAGARRGYRGGYGRERWLAVPQKAETRPCLKCTEALIEAGKPIPPCGLCKGYGEVKSTTRTDGPRGSTIRFSQYRCPACHGKTAPPIERASK